MAGLLHFATMNKNMPKHLLRRTVQEWDKKLNKLPKEDRDEVGKLLWWDWFSDREVYNRWKRFDKYLGWRNDLPKLSEERMFFYLTKFLDYPEWLARNRSKIERYK